MLRQWTAIRRRRLFFDGVVGNATGEYVSVGAGPSGGEDILRRRSRQRGITVNHITQRETFALEELIASEVALHAKLRFYAETAGEEHVRRLCDQLADRSREHLTALARALDEHGAGSPGGPNTVH